MDTRYWQCGDSDAEYGLTSCPSFHYNYWYYGTAGLFCYSLVGDSENSGAEVIPTCTHGNVRLMGGTTLNEGRVEICYNGSWSSICYGINLITATVICKQLHGLQYAGKNQILCMGNPKRASNKECHSIILSCANWYSTHCTSDYIVMFAVPAC